jgi:E3 ubiquitin-protein ligase HECTD3
MKRGTIIQRFSLIIDPGDSSYLPRRIVVEAGTSGNLSVVSQRNYSSSDYEKRELDLFPYPLTVHYPIIEVRFTACYQGGIDCRIHGIKILCQMTNSVILESENIRSDVFTAESTARWPKLQPFTPEQLFYRSLCLKRVAYLIDKDLPYILPQWRYSTGGLGGVTSMRQLWPLCVSRNALIDQMLQKTTDSPPSDPPVVYINRIAAKQHREDPTIDPEHRKTVFNQLLVELKKNTKPHEFTYRWAANWPQWWECKFLQEGVIDQGGGFRDSLSDVGEELCPTSLDADVPLPLFIRSPNQSQDSSNVYRDAYIPNPSCKLMSNYFFVGQLMGAVFRSAESLVLSLPQFVWKQLVGESITWTRDFVSVDSAEVKLIDSLEGMTREIFDSTFADILNFTAVLSNGETVDLVPNGENRYVTYDDRLEYCQLVKDVRMKESKAQIEAIKDGLTHVVPAQALSLLTWQELENKVCGSPEIPIDELKKAAMYDSDLSPTSPNVKVMWEALEGFTDEERSRFIRFITGRRRLPVTIYIEQSDTGPSSLPTSATCSNCLYLPSYTTVEQAAQKLRYAAYNCVAIDTDMSPWE